jgi:threonine dehydratase
MSDNVTYSDIQEAAERLHRYRHVPDTVPVIDAPELAAAVGAKSVKIVLDTPKPNGLPDGGNTFKLRGAANKLFHALEDRNAHPTHQPMAFIAASAGNHAQGVAAAANRAAKEGLLKEGDSVHIFMPENSALIKQQNTKALGENWVTLHLKGHSFREARAAAEAYAANLKEQGTVVMDVHPFDDKDVIAGQGTLGREIFEQYKPDVLFAPCGGGGLLSGLALAAAEKSPKTVIVGVEPNYAPSGCMALMDKPNTRVKHEYPKPSAGPVAGGITVHEIGQLTRKILKENSVHMHTVGQNMMLFSTLWLHRLLRQQPNKNPHYAYDVELSAGASMAGLMNAPRDTVRGKNIVIVLTGANREITEQGMMDALHEYGITVSPEVMDLNQFPRQKTLSYSAPNPERAETVRA